MLVTFIVCTSLINNNLYIDILQELKSWRSFFLKKMIEAEMLSKKLG